MGSIIRSIFNPGAAQKKAKKREAQRLADVATRLSETKEKADKLKQSEEVAAGKKRQRRAGRSSRARTRITSPLGLTDTGTGNRL